MNWMQTKTEETWVVKIYLSGPISVAEQVCREECLRKGLCVTIEPTLYIYTGGEERGFVVGLLNYPRFPTSPEDIAERAEDLAIKLLDRTCQHSALIVTPKMTKWITVREDK